MPSLVIDIGNANGSKCLRLIQTNRMRGLYATLKNYEPDFEKKRMLRQQMGALEEEIDGLSFL
jgi:hypothetical protein